MCMMYCNLESVKGSFKTVYACEERERESCQVFIYIIEYHSFISHETCLSKTVCFYGVTSTNPSHPTHPRQTKGRDRQKNEDSISK